MSAFFLSAQSFHVPISSRGPNFTLPTHSLSAYSQDDIFLFTLDLQSRCPCPLEDGQKAEVIFCSHAHSHCLRGTATGNLLNTQLIQLGLQLLQLLRELILVLAPKLAGLDFRCRLRERMLASAMHTAHANANEKIFGQKQSKKLVCKHKISRAQLAAHNIP